jgi:hypothetical protein
MAVLGGWAAVNMAAGGVGLVTAQDPRWRGFHLGNLSWNAVNLGIAGAGWLTQAREAPGAGFPETLLASQKTRVVLAVNAGIDVAYITAGAWIRSQGLTAGDATRQGVGEAVAANGLFLLGFDVAMLALHGRNDGRLVRPWVAGTGDAAQLGVVIRR